MSSLPRRRRVAPAEQIDAAVLHVVQKDEPFSSHFGKAASGDAIFLLGSISKPINVTAVMTLFDQGEVSALNAGRSFVTTGPLLRVQVNGRSNGETLQAKAPLALRITGLAESAAPLDRLEIIVNGDVVHTMKPENKPTDRAAYRNEIDYKLTAGRTSWVAVRAFEQHPQKRIRFAHSSPVHVEIAGLPIRAKRAEVEYFIGRVQRELDRNASVLSEPALDEHRAALRFYKDLLLRAD
jgi:hypothetical protein